MSFASMVRMVKVSTASPGRRSASEPGSAAPSGTRQRSHNPANAISPPSRRAMSQGSRTEPSDLLAMHPVSTRVNHPRHDDSGCVVALATTYRFGQAVARTGVIDEFGEAGAIRALPGRDVGEDTNGAGFEQANSLSGQALVGSRDAGVAQRVTGPSRHGRLNIVRFQDGFRVHT